MVEITTIKIEKTTKSRLDNLKEDKGESYNSVIKKMLFVLNAVRKDPDSAKKILSNVDKNIKRRNLINNDFKGTLVS